MLLGAGSDRLHCKQTGANYDEIFSLFFLAFKSTNEFNMCNFLEKILVYVICLFLNHFEWRLRYLCTLETSLKNTFGGKKTIYSSCPRLLKSLSWLWKSVLCSQLHEVCFTWTH